MAMGERVSKPQISDGVSSSKVRCIQMSKISGESSGNSMGSPSFLHWFEHAAMKKVDRRQMIALWTIKRFC